MFVFLFDVYLFVGLMLGGNTTLLQVIESGGLGTKLGLPVVWRLGGGLGGLVGGWEGLGGLVG